MTVRTSRSDAFRRPSARLLPFRSRHLAMALAAGLAFPTIGNAQQPWTVTVTPTMDPLPIGSCAAVWLTARDPRTGEVPRNPLGQMVTIADFDMVVSSPDGKSVAGQPTDRYHWSACGCLGAEVGTEATVTATYPAKELPPASQVRDVAFQVSGTFKLAAARGSTNPAVCSASRVSAVAQVAPLTPAPVTLAPSPPPAAVPVTAAPPQPVAVLKQPARAAPLPAGAPPGNVKVEGNPAEAFVSWWSSSAIPRPINYQVERWKSSDPACCRATSPNQPQESPGTVYSWRDPLQGSGEWTYQVTATYADGRRGSATAKYTYPEPEAPKNPKAVQIGRNSVLFTWQPVSGASYYVVAGPPSNSAVRVVGTSLTREGVPFGNTTWQVSAMYLGGPPEFSGGVPSGAPPLPGAPPVPQQGSTFATTNLVVVNPHYRLVAEMIRVTAETVDQPMSLDGKFDEVYVSSMAEKYNRNGMTLDTRYPVQLSQVHGDVTFWLPSERVQAGTASASGGIKAGDIVTPIWSAPTPSQLTGAPPFVLWDGELIPGKHDLVLHPMIWELDQPTGDGARVLGGACINRLCSWAKFLAGGGDGSWYWHHQPAASAAIAGTQIAVLDGDNIWLGTTGAGGGMVHLERHNQDRPIGLAVNTTDPNPDGMGLVGNWIDKVVILSSEKIEAALAAGNHTIDVRFWDRWNLPNIPPGSVNYLNGDYTLVIRIQRMP